MIEKDLDCASRLTFLAEEAGDIALATGKIEETRSWLHGLLYHLRPYVREGAIYGLGKLPPSEETRQALMALLAIEPSPGVRDAAEDVIEDRLV